MFTTIHLYSLGNINNDLSTTWFRKCTTVLQFWQRVIQNQIALLPTLATNDPLFFSTTAVNHLATIAASSPTWTKGSVRVVCQEERGMKASWHSRFVVPVSIISEQGSTPHLIGTSRCMHVTLLPCLSWNHLCFVMCFVLREPAIWSWSQLLYHFCHWSRTIVILFTYNCQQCWGSQWPFLAIFSSLLGWISNGGEPQFPALTGRQQWTTIHRHYQ